MSTIFRQSHKPGRVFSILAIAALCGMPFPSRGETRNMQGTWVSHPGANLSASAYASHIHRMVDGNAYTYFSVRGRVFDRYHKATEEMNSLYRYDKSAPWEENAIRPLAWDYALSGSNVSLLDYSPEAGVLAVLYDNGCVDFIFDDGRFVASSGLRDLETPGTVKSGNGLSIDSGRGEAYLATSFGYLRMSLTDGSLIGVVHTDQPLLEVRRIGDRMVVIGAKALTYASATTSLYSFPVDAPPASLEGSLLTLPAPFATNQPTMTGGTISNPQRILPLSDTSFVVASTPTNNTPVQYSTVTLSADGATCAWIGQYTIPVAGSSNHSWYRHMLLTEQLCTETAGGWFISGRDQVLHISKGIEPDCSSSSTVADYRSRAVRVISRPSGRAVTEQNSVLSSADGSRVWMYEPWRGFYYRDINEAGAWSTPSQVVAPNAPGALVANSLDYNPQFGIIARGPGSMYGYGLVDGDYDNISSYRDGVWTSRDLKRNPDPSVSTLAPATSQARWADTDPLNPAWVWGSTYLRGFYRQNIEDPSDFLILGRTTDNRDQIQTKGGWVGIFGANEPAYPTLCNFSNASFDSEGRMWFARDLAFDFDWEAEFYDNCHVDLHYYTAEERLAMKGGAGASAPKPHTLSVPHASTDRFGMLRALKAPGNENLLLYTPGFYVNAPLRQLAFLIDHNGTPEDTSDDRVAFIDKVFDRDGATLFGTMYSSLYEDPVSGEVWVNTLEGPMVFNPHDILEGRNIGRRLPVDNPSTGLEEMPFDQVWVSEADSDNYGRKWVATRSGLYCLSADTRTILGHWHRSNSPLPSDELLAVACDLSDGSVFVGTDRGLMQFIPEGEGVNPASPGRLAISPAYVHPDFNGYVTVTGADGSREYEVVDESGNVVVSLGRPEGGRLQWDHTLPNGRRVPEGKYSVVPSGSGFDAEAEIRIL